MLHLTYKGGEADIIVGPDVPVVAYVPIDGRTVTARSRRGAPNELARLLAAAGIPDGPMHVLSNFDPHVALRYRSFHAVAGYTYTESDRPLQRVRYVAPQDRFQAIREASKQGGVCPGRNPGTHRYFRR